MKLHDAETERELLRLAVVARKGKAIPKEGGWRMLWNSAKPHLSVLLMSVSYPFLMMVSGHELTTFWKETICAVVLMATAISCFDGILRIIHPSGDLATLANLPISGERVFQWMRRRIFVERWFRFFAACTACAFVLKGFTGSSAWPIAVTTLLFLAITASTAILMGDDRLLRLKVVKAWRILTGACGIGGILLMFNPDIVLTKSPVSSPIIQAISGLTWLFPPSWCMPGRMEHGGGWLSALWIGWGAIRWITWPKSAGKEWDQARDFLNAPGDFKLSQSAEAVEPPRPLEFETPLAMPQSGWVDRWIQFIIGKKDRDLAGAICHPIRSWSWQTRWLIVSAPVWIALIWLGMKLFPIGGWEQGNLVWQWSLAIALPLVGLLPLTHAIPRAFSSWPPGAQGMPFFSALPISSRDLLRISTRIALARILIMIPIATPISLLLLLAILPPGHHPWASLWLVPSIGCFWLLARPILIMNRLNEGCRRRSGLWLFHVLIYPVPILLMVAWLVSGVAGMLAGCGAFPVESPWLRALLVIGGLALSGLCARALFEIHLWRLKRGHFDWCSKS